MNVIVLPTASVKIPTREPDVKFMVPLNTALVLPMSVLSTVNEPLGFTVSGPLSASVWPFIANVTVPAPLVPRMIPPTVVAVFNETITPALVMIAVSVVPGTEFGFQFAAVFQLPLAALVQLIVADEPEITVVRDAATTRAIAVKAE